MKNKILLFLKALLPFNGINNITSEEFHTLLSSDFKDVLLDVRNPDELKDNMNSLKGAVNIPLPELPDRFDELNTYKNNNIYVMCHSGGRSSIATRMLTQSGYSAVNITGGMQMYRNLYPED